MAKTAGKSAEAAPAPQPQNEEVGSKHNLPTREDRARLRLSHIDQIRRARDERMKAQEVVKTMRKAENKLRNAYQNDGFSLALLDEAFDREDTPGRDLQAYEVERHELFEDMGQPVYVQPDLFEAMADADYWQSAGYQAGIAGKQGRPPEKLAPEFHQPWMRGWTAGQEKLAWALAERTDLNPEHRSGRAVAAGPTAGEIAREPEPADVG